MNKSFDRLIKQERSGYQEDCNFEKSEKFFIINKKDWAKRKLGKSGKTALGILLIMVILSILLFLLFLPIFSAIPQDITINGRLTNSAGSSLAGTNTVNFSIYDSSTGGNTLYSLNTSVTSDSNGVFNVRLTGVTLNFSNSYYLGIKVSSDSEMTPRVNLSSSPYTFRAKNISVEGIEFTSSVNVGNNNFTVNGTTFFVNVANARVGIGTINPSNFLDVRGAGNFSGTVYINNATDVSTLGSRWATNGSNLYNSTAIYVGIGTTNPTAKLEISKSGNGNLSLNVSGILYVNDSSVGIGTTSSKAMLHINSTAATTKGLIVQGAASQSANLQEWQNSAGAVVASITAAGNVNADGGSVYVNSIYGSRFYDTGGDGYQLAIYNRYGNTFYFRNAFIAPYFALGGGEVYTHKIRDISAASALDFNQLNGGASVTPLSLVGLYGGSYTNNARHATDINIVLGYGGVPPSGTITGGDAGKFNVHLQPGGVGSGGAAAGSNGSFNIYNNASSNIFTVTHSGNVGIGTTTPSNLLDVRGVINASGLIYFNNGTAVGSGNLTSGAGGGSSGYISQWNTGTSLNNSIIFQNGSNVGIGTTTPKAKLEVSNSTLGILFNPIGGGGDGNSPYINTTANNLTIRSTGGSVIVRLG